VKPGHELRVASKYFIECGVIVVERSENVARLEYTLTIELITIY
jgi:hypothetical protein